jgi:hypothetical protein
MYLVSMRREGGECGSTSSIKPSVELEFRDVVVVEFATSGAIIVGS